MRSRWLDRCVHRIGKRLARIAAFTASFAIGPLVLTASCSSDGGAPGSSPPPPASNDGSTNAADANANDASDATIYASDSPLCAPPADAKARCTGYDPTFVFFPPLACDPTMLGADASSDANAVDANAADANSNDASDDASATDAGDAGADAGPCVGVTPLDVSFTAEACGAFADAEAQGLVSTETSPRTPTILEPSDGDALSPDNWSIFSWIKGAGAKRSPIDRALDWLEPSAHALVPINGDGYVLELSQGCHEVLRVMVATDFWAPDPTTWARLASTKGPVTVRVIWAKFANNALAPGTVPVASPPITITMKN
jgi:hypothetical protein